MKCKICKNEADVKGLCIRCYQRDYQKNRARDSANKARRSQIINFLEIMDKGYWLQFSDEINDLKTVGIDTSNKLSYLIQWANKNGYDIKYFRKYRGNYPGLYFKILC